MTSRLVVNNIDNDTGVTTIRLNPTYSSFELNSAERLRIASGGQIGIGITNPEAYEGNGNNLVVGDTTNHNGITILTGTDKDGRLGFADGTGAASYRGMIEYQHGTGADEFMKFAVAGDERLRITSSGSIGIGTNDPATEVHLYGNAPVMTVTPTNWQSGLRLNVVGLGYHGSNNQLFRVQRDGTTKLQLNEDGDLVITGDDNAELKLKCGTSSGNAIIAFLNSSGSTKGNIFYDTDDNFMVFKTNGTAGANERVRITSSGNVNLNENVGIQTSSVEGADLVGAGTSFFGAYIGDGMLAFHNRLDNSAGYYVAAHVNALNAGPVTLGSTMTIAGTWVIV